MNRLLEIQRCPACRKDLDRKDYPASHWNKPGRYCSSCHVSQQRRRTLRTKYGLTPEGVDALVTRQSGRCYGCQKDLPANYVIDHDHASGVVRGLLCRPCNLTLGLVKDNQAVLRRLMAYLERDPTKQLVYLAGALKNERIPLIGNALRAVGFDVMDEWWTPGRDADVNWQHYETVRGRTFIEALRGRAATNTFLFDKSYIDLCDTFVVVMPAGKSAMLELGYAKGSGKPSYMLLDESHPERYDVMPAASDDVFNTVDELIRKLQEGDSCV